MNGIRTHDPSVQRSKNVGPTEDTLHIKREFYFMKNWKKTPEFCSLSVLKLSNCRKKYSFTDIHNRKY
jgi:hypothetical protein